MTLEKLIEKYKEKWFSQIEDMREMILANLVMVSQIPAPTFKEQERAEFILNRYIESGLLDPYRDEVDNVIGVLPGKKSNKKIMITSHMDNIFSIEDDHNVKVNVDYAQGAGVADNSMGLAVLVTMPEILKALKIKFNSDIVFLVSTRSVGRGDFQGIRHFIKNTEMPIDFSLSIEGVQLGRLDYFSLSNVQCDIQWDLNLEEASVWGELGNTNAVLILNDLMNSILSIPTPGRPQTVLSIGFVKSGETYDTLSSKGKISLIIRSEKDNITDGLMYEIKEVCKEVGLKHNLKIVPEFFGRQHASGLKFSHPLVRNALNIIESIGYTPKVRPSDGEITVSLAKNIPSITLGVSTGKKSTLPNGLVYLDPISKGVVQILLLLLSIDKGLCDES